MTATRVLPNAGLRDDEKTEAAGDDGKIKSAPAKFGARPRRPRLEGVVSLTLPIRMTKP